MGGSLYSKVNIEIEINFLPLLTAGSTSQLSAYLAYQ
jgi:hypothetical protein